MARSGHPDGDKPSGGVTIGNIFGGIHNSIIAGRDVIIKLFNITINVIAGNVDEQRIQRAERDRRAMLELVKLTWVKGVLEQSLHGAVMIELGMEERAGAVEHPWDRVLQMPGQLARPIAHGTKIVSVFDAMSQALLILGAPGSGKTTMLLELARDLIARTEKDLTLPIPVVLNLSSWAEKCQPIAEWLVEELNTKYNIPKKIARPWVDNDELLLLLDGLDEVKLERRDACVRAINDFRQGHGLVPLAVCSRVADYEALVARLKLHGAVLLRPLTPKQVDKYLEGAGVELLAVCKTLRHDPSLQELAQSPLMLSIMTLAYRGMSVQDLGSVDSVEARRKHVFDAYIQQMLERVGRSKRELYSQGQTQHWLTWLAQKMIEHRQSVFLLERMRRSWLQTRAQQRLHGVISGLVSGLVIGPFWGLFFGLLGGLDWALGVGLVFGLSGGLGLGLSEAVRPTELLKWSWKRGRRALDGRLVAGLVVLGLVVGLFGGPVAGPVVALVFGLVNGLVNGLESAELETRTVPNQGIRQSMTNAIIVVLVSGLGGGLALGLAVGLVVARWGGGLVVGSFFGLGGGLAAGLAFGLEHGGAAVIQHYTLRFILCCDGYIPWNYARFLDYAAERIFLRKVGGGYIFVHRLLMEYFASLEPG